MRRYIKYAIIFLVILLFVLCIFLVRNYIALRRAPIMSVREAQLSADDSTVIRPWMTFEYINKLFNIPPDYFKNALSISDPSYPQLSLYGYANHQHVNATIVVNEVESSTHDYLTATSTH